MKYLSKVIVIACAIAVLLGSTRVAAQVSVDLENRYSNVGAIMVWRVDSSGTPVQLRGFVSGTLIRDRVMVTAGHFTGSGQGTRRIATFPSIFCEFQSDGCEGPEDVDSSGPASYAPIDAALPAAASVRSNRRNPGRSTGAWHCRRWTSLPRILAQGNRARPFRRARQAREIRRSANNNRGIRHNDAAEPECAVRYCELGWEAARQNFGIA